MIAKYLLDTNVISEWLRPHPAPGILRRLREHDGEMAIPAPVWRELQVRLRVKERGIHRGHRGVGLCILNPHEETHGNS